MFSTIQCVNQWYWQRSAWVLGLRYRLIRRTLCDSFVPLNTTQKGAEDVSCSVWKVALLLSRPILWFVFHGMFLPRGSLFRVSCCWTRGSAQFPLSRGESWHRLSHHLLCELYDLWSTTITNLNVRLPVEVLCCDASCWLISTGTSYRRLSKDLLLHQRLAVRNRPSHWVPTSAAVVDAPAVWHWQRLGSEYLLLPRHLGGSDFRRNTGGCIDLLKVGQWRMCQIKSYFGDPNCTCKRQASTVTWTFMLFGGCSLFPPSHLYSLGNQFGRLRCSAYLLLTCLQNSPCARRYARRHTPAFQ